MQRMNLARKCMDYRQFAAATETLAVILKAAHEDQYTDALALADEAECLYSSARWCSTQPTVN